MDQNTLNTLALLLAGSHQGRLAMAQALGVAEPTAPTYQRLDRSWPDRAIASGTRVRCVRGLISIGLKEDTEYSVGVWVPAGWIYNDHTLQKDQIILAWPNPCGPYMLDADRFEIVGD